MVMPASSESSSRAFRSWALLRLAIAAVLACAPDLTAAQAIVCGETVVVGHPPYDGGAAEASTVTACQGGAGGGTVSMETIQAACAADMSAIGGAMAQSEAECTELLCGTQVAPGCLAALSAAGAVYDRCIPPNQYFDGAHLYQRMGHLIAGCAGGTAAPPPPVPPPPPAVVAPTRARSPTFCGAQWRPGVWTSVAATPSCNIGTAPGTNLYPVTQACGDIKTVLAYADEEMCQSTLCGYSAACKAAIRTWSAAYASCMSAHPGEYLSAAVEAQTYGTIVARNGVCDRSCLYDLTMDHSPTTCATTVSVGSQCRFSCAQGYQKIGTHTCGSNLRFSGGSCIQPACGNFPIAHSNPPGTTCSGGLPGDPCQFQCAAGYTGAVVTCRFGGSYVESNLPRAGQTGHGCYGALSRQL